MAEVVAVGAGRPGAAARGHAGQIFGAGGVGRWKSWTKAKNEVLRGQALGFKKKAEIVKESSTTREKRSLEVRAFYCVKLGQLKFALLAAGDRREPFLFRGFPLLATQFHRGKL